MPSPLTSPAALAETLLQEWEARARPARTPAYAAARPALLAQLTAFSALLLTDDDVNVDAEDARTVLGRAAAFGLGHAATAGPARAARLMPLLAVDLRHWPPAASPTHWQPIAALLSIQSGTEHELEMDELTEIVEAVQHTILTPKVEMIFGHGISAEAEEAGLVVWLLVGYAAAEETAASAASIPHSI